MIKYKYLPFTRNKPRYQRVPEPTAASKWQLAAQTLPSTTTATASDRKEEKQLNTTDTTAATVVGSGVSTTTLATASTIKPSATTATTGVAKPPQIIMIDEWIKLRILS